MHAESLQELLLFGALLFACAALVQVLAERHLVGSYTVAVGEIGVTRWAK